jgi:DNA-binding PadR family transcriptional regulator
MEIEAYLPLQEPTFFILLSLRSGEKHGYAILKEVTDLSAGKLSLSTGTLYGALNRLLDQGLIERVDLGVQAGSRGKKSYQLTHMGRLVFEAEVNRMQRLLATVHVYE